MAKMKRQSGSSFGEITIGSVKVRARWRYSYLQASEGEGKPLEGNPGREDFKFIAVLSIAERKKLANLKQGDWTRLTAGPFVDLPVCLKEIEYKDGGRDFSRGPARVVVVRALTAPVRVTTIQCLLSSYVSPAIPMRRSQRKCDAAPARKVSCVTYLSPYSLHVCSTSSESAG